MGLFYQELRNIIKNSIVLEKQENIEIKQNSSEFSHIKKTYTRETVLYQPQPEKKNSSTDRNLSSTNSPKKNSKSRKQQTASGHLQHEIEKLQEQQQQVLPGLRNDKNKYHTQNNNKSKESAETWAEHLAGSCCSKDIAKEKFSLKHQCVSTSPRYSDDEALTARPRKRSVASQMPARQQSFQQQHAHDDPKPKSHGGKNKNSKDITNKKYINSDRPNITSSQQTIIKGCYGCMQHSICTFTQPVQAVICCHGNYQQQAPVFTNTGHCANCKSLCASSCSAAPSKPHTCRRQNTDLETQHFAGRPERKVSSPKTRPVDTKSRRMCKNDVTKNGDSAELKDFMERKKRECEKQRESFKNQMKKLEQKHKAKEEAAAEKRPHKTQMFGKLLSESETCELIRCFRGYIEEREKKLKLQSHKQSGEDYRCTATTAKQQDDDAHITLRKNQQPLEVCKYVAENCADGDGSSLAHQQYSSKTLDMLKKMRIYEYKPQKPCPKKQEDKQNYQQYLQKFAKEDEEIKKTKIKKKESLKQDSKKETDVTDNQKTRKAEQLQQKGGKEQTTRPYPEDSLQMPIQTFSKDMATSSKTSKNIKELKRKCAYGEENNPVDFSEQLYEQKKFKDFNNETKAELNFQNGYKKFAGETNAIGSKATKVSEDNRDTKAALKTPNYQNSQCESCENMKIIPAKEAQDPEQHLLKSQSEKLLSEQTNHDDYQSTNEPYSRCHDNALNEFEKEQYQSTKEHNSCCGHDVPSEFEKEPYTISVSSRENPEAYKHWQHLNKNSRENEMKGEFKAQNYPNSECKRFENMKTNQAQVLTDREEKSRRNSYDSVHLRDNSMHLREEAVQPQRVYANCADNINQSREMENEFRRPKEAAEIRMESKKSAQFLAEYKKESQFKEQYPCTTTSTERKIKEPYDAHDQTLHKEYGNGQYQIANNLKEAQAQAQDHHLIKSLREKLLSEQTKPDAYQSTSRCHANAPNELEKEQGHKTKPHNSCFAHEVSSEFEKEEYQSTNEPISRSHHYVLHELVNEQYQSIRDVNSCYDQDVNSSARGKGQYPRSKQHNSAYDHGVPSEIARKQYSPTESAREKFEAYKHWQHSFDSRPREKEFSGPKNGIDVQKLKCDQQTHKVYSSKQMEYLVAEHLVKEGIVNEKLLSEVQIYERLLNERRRKIICTEEQRSYGSKELTNDTDRELNQRQYPAFALPKERNMTESYSAKELTHDTARELNQRQYPAFALPKEKSFSESQHHCDDTSSRVRRFEEHRCNNNANNNNTSSDKNNAKDRTLRQYPNTENTWKLMGNESQDHYEKPKEICQCCDAEDEKLPANLCHRAEKREEEKETEAYRYSKDVAMGRAPKDTTECHNEEFKAGEEEQELNNYYDMENDDSELLRVLKELELRPSQKYSRQNTPTTSESPQQNKCYAANNRYEHESRTREGELKAEKEGDLRQYFDLEKSTQECPQQLTKVDDTGAEQLYNLKTDEEEQMLHSLDLAWLDEPEANAEENSRRIQFNNDKSTTARERSNKMVAFSQVRKSNSVSGFEVFRNNQIQNGQRKCISHKTLKQEHIQLGLRAKLNKKNFDSPRSYRQPNHATSFEFPEQREAESATLLIRPSKRTPMYLNNVIKQEVQHVDAHEGCLKATRAAAQEVMLEKSHTSNCNDFKKVKNLSSGINSPRSGQAESNFQQAELKVKISKDISIKDIERAEELRPLTHKAEDVLNNLKIWLELVAQTDSENHRFSLAANAAEDLINKLGSCLNLEANRTVVNMENLLKPNTPGQEKSLAAQLVQQAQFKDLETSPDSSDAQLKPAIKQEENVSVLEPTKENEHQIREDDLPLDEKYSPEIPDLNLTDDLEREGCYEELAAHDYYFNRVANDAALKPAIKDEENFSFLDPTKENEHQLREEDLPLDQKYSPEKPNLNLEREVCYEEELAAHDNFHQESYQLEIKRQEAQQTSNGSEQSIVTEDGCRCEANFQHQPICQECQLAVDTELANCCSNIYASSYPYTAQMPAFKQCICMWDTYAEMLDNYYRGRNQCRKKF